MEKPVPKTIEALDYHECRDWIEEKYNIKTRDYLAFLGYWKNQRGLFYKRK